LVVEQPEGCVTESTPYADEGTLLHEAIAILIENPRAPVVGMKYAGIELTRELHDDKLVPALAEFTRRYGHLQEIELEVEVALPIPGAFGTADVVGFADDFVLVLDWKFGDGVLVSAVENDQLQFYAAGVLTEHLPDADDDLVFELAIIQPARGLENICSSWRTTAGALRTWLVTYEAALRAGDREEPHFELGSWCRFCPAKVVCPKMLGVVEVARGPAPTELGGWLDKCDALEQWIAAVRTLAREELERGGTVAGWKLVAKRGSRSWRDENEVWKWLRRNGLTRRATVPTLRSPAQVEKVLGKTVYARMAELVQSVSSGTTLAKADDPRPGVHSATQFAEFAKRLAAATGRSSTSE
jgi:hypothetical protein